MIGAPTVMIGGPNIVINSTSIHRGARVNWRVSSNVESRSFFYGGQRSGSSTRSMRSFFVGNGPPSGESATNPGIFPVQTRTATIYEAGNLPAVVSPATDETSPARDEGSVAADEGLSGFAEVLFVPGEVLSVGRRGFVRHGQGFGGDGQGFAGRQRGFRRDDGSLGRHGRDCAGAGRG